MAVSKTHPATPLYLDYQATTPVDPRVLDAMLPYFSEHFGNAASRNHAHGWRAEAAVERAREQVADAIGATRPDQIVFTSGATESNNLALLGTAVVRARRGRHLISVETEHASVLDPLAHLESHGFGVTRLPVEPGGRVDPDCLREAIREDTVLVSVMAANNEIGVLQPLEALGALCRDAGVIFHSDAAQAATKVPFSVSAACLDLVSLSGHKCYGPKGVGALWVRDRRVRPAPLFHGGGHEGGLRPGTLPVPLLVGMGEAFALAAAEREAEAARLLSLRDRFLRRLREALGSALAVNGELDTRLPGNLNLRIEGVEAALLLGALPDLALSLGSACSTAEAKPSHVLKGLGLSDDAIGCSFRVGMGRGSDSAGVDRAASRIAEEALLLRGQAAPGTLSSTRPATAHRADNTELS